MPRSLLLLVPCLALLCSGCFTTPLQDPRYLPGEEHDEWQSFFLWGLVGEAKVNVREFCPNGEVYEVAVGTNGGTWLVSWVTLGIYSPEKVYVTCSGGRVKQP